MSRKVMLTAGVVLLGTLALGPRGHSEEKNRPAAGPDFDRVVAPLLARRCLDCHGGTKPRGGLDLSHQKTALAGGDDGAVIVPGKPEESLLWEYVAGGKMPPKKPLPAAEKALLRAWIAAGARWGSDPIDPFRATTDRRAGYDWWALQPVRRPRPPSVRNRGWVRNPIDAFVLHRLESRGLEPSPPADRRTLIRRLYFDLLGLPPSPEEVAAFVSDPAPDAYDRLVDRVLASPHYGVRWARHWLDVVRYGESNGFEFDEFRPDAWPYRDWVVAALNRDLPYDEFARLQLAGDALRPNDPEAVQATGFLVAGAYDTVGQTQQSEAMKKVVRQDELEDVVGTVGQTFLGLTVHCARCHDHKFDPIRQVEYYRLTAALGGVRHGVRGLPLPEGQRRSRLAAGLSAFLEIVAAVGNGNLIRHPLARARPSPEQYGSRRRFVARVNDLAALLSGQRGRVYAVTPRQPEVAHLLLRGNPKQPGPVVAAGGVAALAGVSADFGLAPDASEAERRKRLAAWVTHPKNPLFARVMVNRLWHYHFGAGLVETPNDFGFNGGRPSHPELLDWLAAELAQGGWSLKRLHRRMVTSATYRQSSRSNPAAARVDAGNRLLWRKRPMRLEAEAVRDATLCLAGRLNLHMGGPSFRDVKIVQATGTKAQFYVPVDAEGGELDRRTLYRAWTRGGRSRLLDTFDCPDASTTAPKRAVTITPLQALALLNNAHVLRMADHFAERLKREAGPDVAAQVRRAYLLAYGRMPDGEELALARRVVEANGLAVLTRAIFNSSEFLYVD